MAARFCRKEREVVASRLPRNRTLHALLPQDYRGSRGIRRRRGF